MKMTCKTTNLIAGMILFGSTILMAQKTDENLLANRWKVLKHTKAGKAVASTPDDYILLSKDGVYEQARNRFYTKGRWEWKTNELVVTNNGEYKWKVTHQTDKTLSLARGADEVLELEAAVLPAPASKENTQKEQYLCMGKWRPNQHQKGATVVKVNATDFITFYMDGSFERVTNGSYTKGTWKFNEGQTQITLNEVVWKVENISALFLKLSKPNSPDEFIVFAKTR
jgi:hypothetical protein